MTVTNHKVIFSVIVLLDHSGIDNIDKDVTLFHDVGLF